MKLPMLSSFACINDSSESEISKEEENATFSAQLEQLVAFYDRGMQSLTDEDRDEALHYFDQVLHRPMSLEVRKNPPPGKKQSQRFCEGSVKAEGDPLHAVLNVCKASLKQKASLIVDVAPLEALEHLKEVYKLEPSDMVLCKNFGTLALEVGFTDLAKFVLEKALEIRPDFTPLKEPLIEVFLEVQKYEEAVEIARSILQTMPRNKRAKELLQLHKKSDVLLRPNIHRRCDWESVPKNRIYRIIQNPTWTSLAQTIYEIIDGKWIDEIETPDTNAIVLQSAATHWDTLESASMVCEVLYQTWMELDDDEITKTPKQKRQAPGTPTRFPLRSRFAVPKQDDAKTWNVLAMIEKAFSENEWKILTEVALPEISSSIEPESTTNVHNRSTFQSIEAFFKEIGVEKGLSPFTFAIALLEHRLKPQIHLEAFESTALCALDGCVRFKASHFCSLGIGELLLDILQTSENEDSLDLKKDEGTISRCRNHLLNCLGYHSLPEYEDPERVDETFLNDTTSARLFWAVGKLNLIEGRCNEAEDKFSKALDALSRLNGSLTLSHIRNDNVISIDTLRIKNITCLYRDMIDNLPVESENLYSEMCTLLTPVLFPAKKATQPLLTTGHRYKGLCYLQKASKEAKAKENEFCCHLHLLDLSLAMPSMEFRDADREGPSSELPTSLATVVEAVPKKTAFLQILSFVDFVRNQFCQHRLNLQIATIFPSLENPEHVDSLRKILLKSFYHLEWCFWRFCSHSKGSNSQRISRKRALHEAAALVFVLVELDPDFSQNAELMESIAFVLYDLLVERESLIAAKNITLHLLADRFTAWIDFLARVEDEDPSTLKTEEQHRLELNAENKRDIQNIIEALVDGVSHFLGCMYEIDLTTPKASVWSKERKIDESQRALPLREDLKQLWHYLGPCLSYLESREGDLHIFAKLKGLLMILFDLLEPPSIAVLNRLSLDPIFDSDDPEIDQALEMGQLPNVLSLSLSQREERVQNIDHLDIYENLYYYICLASLEGDLDLSSPEGILSDNGMQILEESLKCVKLDLAFNPDRYWTWETIGLHFKDATECFITACVRDVLPEDIQSSPAIMDKWKTLVRLQKRCFSIAAFLAKDQKFHDDFCYVQEMLIELDRLLLTHPVPFLFWNRHRPRQLTLEEQEKAFRIKSRIETLIESQSSPKWQLWFHLGKFVWKLKAPGWQRMALENFSRSVEASIEEGGLLDPLYKLHASRLKLVLSEWSDWDVLTQHMFQPLTETNSDPFSRVLDDCQQALEFCRAKMPSYHRVHFHLAQICLRNGNSFATIASIQPLFAKGRKKFCVTFSPIDDRSLRPSQRVASQIPIKISGTGSIEPVWKFIDALRKYFVFYIKLLLITKDVKMLHNIHDVLLKGDFDGPTQIRTQKPHSFKFLCLSDMPGLVLGVRLLVIHDGLRMNLSPQLVLNIEQCLQSALFLLFETVVEDADYASAARALDQIIQNIFHSVSQLNVFNSTFLSEAITLLCDSQCDLDREIFIQSLTQAMTEFPSETGQSDPKAVLEWIRICVSIYPMLVLSSQDPVLTSNLTATSNHRSLKMDIPNCRHLLQRILFAMVQVLFYKAEDIRIKAPAHIGSTESTDITILEIMMQTSGWIRSFGDVLIKSRFLCLRVIHLMRDLYEATCILHGAEVVLALEPKEPLRVQCQNLLAEIQKIQRMEKPSWQCIDLTMDDETHSKGNEEDTVMRLNDRSRPNDDRKPEEHRSIESGPSLRVDSDFMDASAQTDVMPSDPQSRRIGAFVDAFQQFMNCGDPDENND